jgi:plastocyanin
VLCTLLAGSVVAVAVPLVAACGDEDDEPTNTPGASGGAGGSVVEMTNNFRFEPESLTVPSGTTVTFKNVGSMPHNVVTDPELASDPAHAQVPPGAEAFESPMVNGDDEWQYTFETPGEYRYFCQPHEALGMVGTITVTG